MPEKIKSILIQNSTSKELRKDFQNFYEVIDYIATYYILTMDFQSLKKLYEKDYKRYFLLKLLTIYLILIKVW
jgi:hypothetical protein